MPEKPYSKTYEKKNGQFEKKMFFFKSLFFYKIFRDSVYQ